MCSGVCSRRCAKQTGAGECSDELVAAACFKGAQRRGVGVLLAGSTCDGRVLPESVSNDDLSQRYGQPYAERGHACVWCVVLCVALRVPGGHHVRLITCCDDSPLTALLGRRKVDSYYTHFSFAFWAIYRRNASLQGVCLCENQGFCNDDTTCRLHSFLCTGNIV